MYNIMVFEQNLFEYLNSFDNKTMYIWTIVFKKNEFLYSQMWSSINFLDMYNKITL